MEPISTNAEGRVDLQRLYASMLDSGDTAIWHRFLPCYRLFRPDMVIAPDGCPYLYRWYLFSHTGDNKYKPNVLFHIQTQSDPERPKHDHPWDTMSVILAGAGYAEAWNANPKNDNGQSEIILKRRVGDVIHRAATVAHRLILPPGIGYTMTLFSTGPKVREWGFWYPDGWHDNHRHVVDRDGQSGHVKEG